MPEQLQDNNGSFDSMLQTLIQPEYTQADENSARNNVMDEIKSNQYIAKMQAQEKKIGELESMFKKVIGKYESDTSVLRSKIEQLTATQQTLKSDTGNIMEDILGGKYRAEMDRIKNNDLYKDRFDEASVLKEIETRHGYGQVLVPIETFKIQDYDKVAEENKVLKDKYAMATGERLFDTPFARQSASNVKKSTVDLTNVNNPDLQASILYSKFDEL